MILIFTLTHDTETKETCLISNVTPTEAGLTILRQLVNAPIKRELPDVPPVPEEGKNGK